MKISNLNNKNQFIVEIDGKKLFQSYETVMAVIDSNNNLFVNMNMEHYSTTTARYMKQFLEQYDKEYNRNRIFEEIAKNTNEKIKVNDESLIEIK